MTAIGLPVDVITIGASLWAAAFSASFIGNIVGAGGGLIIIPIMHLIFMQLGLDSSSAMLLTVGTSSCAMLLNGPRAILRHQRIDNIEWPIVRHWILPVAGGATLTHLLGFSSDGNVLKAVFAAVAFLIGVYMLVGQERWRLASKVPLGPTWWALGFVLGLLSPLVGMTGTIIAIPAMVACGMPLRRAIGTGAMLTLLVGVPSFIAFVSQAATLDIPYTIGYINLPAAFIIFLAGWVGTPLGVMVQQKLPPNVLRLAFAAILFASAARFFWLSLA